MSVSPGGVTPSGATFAATEAATFSGTVASFTSQEANPQSAGDYSAKIDWGDGGQSTGTIVASGGAFSVIGDHTFADDRPDNVTVVIKDAINNQRYTATSRANVAEVPLTLTAHAIEATEGTSFSGSLATLTDPGTSGNPNEYWAAIDWGDGHTTWASLTHTGGANFDVSGRHTYTEEGTFTARAIAAEIDSISTQVSATASVTVHDGDNFAPLSVTISPAEGHAFSGPVTTFLPLNSSADPSDFLVSIDWGDGQTTGGSIDVSTLGWWDVVGGHTYGDEGTYSVVVTLAEDDPGGASFTSTNVARVADADVLLGTGQTLSATEGSVFTGAVATFVNTGYAANPASDFNATIDWGDGTVDAGTVGGTGGNYTVSGSHSYLEEGAYTPLVTLSDELPGTASATVNSTANVAEADTFAPAAPLTLTAIEGAVVTGNVAIFADSGYPTNDPADFTANMDWGDGTTDSGTVATAGDGSFTVSGSHTYADDGAYAITTTIVDQLPGTAIGTATAVANIAEADLTLTPAVATFTATEGSIASGVVATISDPGSNDPATNYSAAIDWGDGTVSTGTVAGAAGSYLVTGDHVYADEGDYTVTVVASETSAVPVATATATLIATIVDADVLVGAGMSLTSTEGTAFSGAVATFTNTGYAGNPASDFTATIDWGDGTVDAGTVGGTPGSYTVTGNHTYLDEGAYAPLVTLVEDTPGTASATASSNIAVAEGDSGSLLSATISATEGQAFSGAVAGFTDNFLGQVADDFTSTINWGDGTTTAGTVTGGNGSFTISGNHTYADEGTYSITASFSDDPPSTLTNVTINSTAIVADGDVLAGAGLSLTATEGVSFSGTVATFANTGYAGNLPDDFTAQIDWGDGTVDSGTLTGTAGDYTVSGSHSYLEEGTYSPLVTLADEAPGSASATAASTMIVADAALSATGTSISATEGQALTGVVVASFADADPAGAVSDYTAMIDWGDGTTDAGTVSSDGSGGFQVSGTHTYAEEGTNSVTVSIADTGGSTASVSTTVNVTDAALTATGTSIAATEGQALTGVVVASFADADPAGAVSDYTATIDWGDGTTDAGTVSSDGSGGFQVSGTHTYAEEGTNSVTVSIADLGGSTATANSTVTVADAALSASGTTIAATEGQALTGVVVASFADADPAGDVSDYTATIDWGDGTTDAGTVASDGSGGFQVSGTHTYAEEGTNSVTVSIADLGGSTASASTTVNVTDAALTATGTSIAATEGQVLTGAVVASFADADPAGDVKDYTATIDWGDGTTDAGTVASDGSGGFQVSGTHTYAEEGTNSVTVSIADLGGSTATANSTVNVADAALSASGTTIAATEGQALTGVVANFTDADPAGDASDYTATIDWGDGITDAGTVASDGSGGFQVSGAHTYAEEGTGAVTVTIVDAGGSTATANSTVTMADAALSASGTTIAATEGQALNGVVVASFSDADPAGDVNDYTAMIDWGDGTTDAGTIASNGSGGVQVSGTHTYAEEGTNSVTVSIADTGGSTASVSTTVNVTDAALTATGTSIAATEGQALTGVVVASFADADPAGAVSDYTATIDWGDGTTDTGTVSSDGSGGFQVSGTHTYAEEGTNSVTVSIADTGGSTAIASSTVNVADAALSASGTTIAATEGQAFTQVVASFTDADPAGDVKDYTATIDWGDGTTDTGSVVSNGSGGFQVSGTHTYAEEGNSSVTVNISDVGGSTATANSIVNVTDAALSASGTTITATEGQALTGVVVASFTDADPAGDASDYTATIDWGDGITDIGTVASDGGSGFQVSGTHTYAEEGTGAVTVTIVDAGGSTASANSTITISDAALSATSAPIAATQGQVFTGLVANFTDADPAGGVSDYTATIDWGDGTTDTGAVSTNGSGGFNVSGTHTYAAIGASPVIVTINDVGGESATATSSAAVASALVSVLSNSPIVGGGVTLNGNEYTALSNVTVATFSHDGGADPVGNFTANIEWGDGTSSAGTVSLSGGTYTVTGSHSYTDEGAYAVTVNVDDVPDSVSVAINSSAVMAEELLPGGGTGTANERFVNELYREYLGRPVDASALAFWTAELNAGVTRVTVASQLVAAANAGELRNQIIDHAFQTFLHRSADTSALAFFGQLLATGGTTEQLTQIILSSTEYFDVRGGGTVDGFLGAVYQDLLDRPIDSATRSGFEQVMALGVTRTQVIATVMQSAEYDHIVVQQLFTAYLHRSADAGAQSAFSAQLAAGVSEVQVIGEILGSNEFFSQVS